MNARRRFVTGLLVLLMLGLSVPPKNSCAESLRFAKADETAIIRHEPQVMSTAEKEIEYGPAQSNKYIWMGAVGLLALAAGTVVLVAGGEDSEDKNEGVTIGW